MKICILGQSSEIAFKKNEASKKDNSLKRINGCELLLPPVIGVHCIEELYADTEVPLDPLPASPPPRQFPPTGIMTPGDPLYSANDVAEWCEREFGDPAPSQDSPEAATAFWRRFTEARLSGHHAERARILQAYLESTSWHGFIGDWDWLIVDCAAIVRDIDLFLHGADRDELDADSIVNVIEGDGPFVLRTLYQWAEKIEDRMRRGQCILLLNDRETARLSEILVSHLYSCKDSAYERSSNLQDYLDPKRYVPSADSKSCAVETEQAEEYPDPPPSLTDEKSWGCRIRCIREVPDASPASHKSPKTVPSFHKPAFALDGFDPDAGWSDDPEVDRTLERRTPVDRFCSNSNGLSVLATDAHGYPVSFMLARGQGALVVLPRPLLGDTFMKKLDAERRVFGLRELNSILAKTGEKDKESQGTTDRGISNKEQEKESLEHWRWLEFVLYERDGDGSPIPSKVIVRYTGEKGGCQYFSFRRTKLEKGFIKDNSGKANDNWGMLRQVARQKDHRSLSPLPREGESESARRTRVGSLRKDLAELLAQGPDDCKDWPRVDWSAGKAKAISKERGAGVWKCAFKVRMAEDSKHDA